VEARYLFNMTKHLSSVSVSVGNSPGAASTSGSSTSGCLTSDSPFPGVAIPNVRISEKVIFGRLPSKCSSPVPGALDSKAVLSVAE